LPFASPCFIANLIKSDCSQVAEVKLKLVKLNPAHYEPVKLTDVIIPYSDYTR